MATSQSELDMSLLTRIAGQTEEYALDIAPEAGQNRAMVSAIERATSLVNGAKTVTTSATALYAGSANLANRRAILVQNYGPNAVYLGTSSVTTANGFELALKASMMFSLSETQTIYGIVASSTSNVRILEVT